MSKKCCVYHSIDLDGWMSAAIVKHFFNGMEDVDFIGYNYGNPIPDLGAYNNVIMCDISFPENEMNLLIGDSPKNDRFIWCDHHVSAISNPNIKENWAKGFRSVNLSACELTWKYFFPNKEMPEIVRLLGRYDCFGHKGTEEELKVLEFQYGSRQCITNYEEAYTELLYSLQNYPVKSEVVIHESGKSIYKYLCTEARQSYKNRFTVYFGDYAFCCINKERFNPINFGIQYHNDKADDIYFYDGVACFHYQNNKWNFSLYNDNGHVDVSLIAKGFGGGGHKGAAGFVVEDLNTVFTQPKQ